MRFSNRRFISITIVLFVLSFIQISSSAIAKWTKSTSQTYAGLVADSDSIYTVTASGTVFRFSKSGGSQLWTSEVMGSVFVSPLIHRGYLYVGSSEGIFALDKNDGKVIGKYITAPQKVLTVPIVNYNRLFIVAESKVFIFDISSDPAGLSQPRIVNLNGNSDSSAFAYGNGIGLFLTDGRLVHVGPTGSAETIFNLGRTVWKAEPKLKDDVIYFGSGRRLYALSTAGSIKWYRDFNGWVSPPEVFDDRIYVGAKDGRLYVLNITGGVIGEFVTGDAVRTPYITGRTIYIPSEDNNIYAVDISTLEQKWNMTLDDWPSQPVISDSVLYTVSFNGTVYAASTLGCEILEPQADAKVAPKAFLSGVGYSDSGLKSVEVRIGDGPWVIARLSEGKWEIEYTIKGQSEGSRLIAQCRATDDTGTEIEPYNSKQLIYVSSETSLPSIILSYPTSVVGGEWFVVDFKDEAGNPLKNVLLTYAGEDYLAENGSVKIIAVEGETALYASKPNYKTEVVTIQVVRPSLMQYAIPIGAVAVVIIIITVLFLTKRWR
ncbi:MAG: PQQ-binding-like beta-propeller repeat protein [Candidatus Micrarchaeia archaeon]